ncbi:MAG: histidine phosphatase family protein [Aerococcaceae bacterium]|nr:histidine phosphatase family protein [Aerococcaceae bacterium]
MPDSVTFYFMRHGETYLNHFERIQGWSNAPLTPKGIEDSHRSGRGLADIRFDAIYTSDLGRTIDTAEIILAENKASENITIQPMKEFREVHFGYFEGLDAPGIWQDMIDSVNHEQGLPVGSQEQVESTLNMFKQKDPSGFAENYLEFWTRVESGLLKLLYKHAGKNHNVLVVCHGLTIRNLLHGLIVDFQIGEHLKNASVSIVKYVDGQFKLLALNQTSHFID